MANDVQTSESMLPGLIAGNLAEEISASFRVELTEGFIPMLDRFPEPAERKILQDRVKELAAACRPLGQADVETARRHLGAMFGGFTKFYTPDAEGTVSSFMLACSNQPLFAIIEACRQFSRGPMPGLKLGDPPSTSQFCPVVEAHARVLANRGQRMARILKADRLIPKLLSDAEREAVGVKIKALAEQLGKRFRRIESARREAQPEWRKKGTERMILEQWAALGLEPQYQNGVLLSPSIAESGAVRRARVAP